MRIGRHLPLVLVVLVAAAAACRREPSDESLRRGEGQEGMASWYGPGFHGRKTANGETYDQDGRTAAHRTLPFGARVRVVRLDTGEDVVVRINDRGPFVRGRVIDLSLGAARAIGLDRDGVARIALTVERWPDEAEAAIYTVQVGAFKDAANARRLRDRLAEFWDDVHIQAWYEFQRVRVGRFASEGAAERASIDLERELQADQLVPFVTREN